MYNLYVIMAHFLFKTGHKKLCSLCRGSCCCCWMICIHIYRQVLRVLAGTNKGKQQLSEELVTDKDHKLVESLRATRNKYQQLSEELKQANNEKQKLAETLSDANNENEQLRQQLSEAKTLLETLRTEYEKEAKLRKE